MKTIRIIAAFSILVAVWLGAVRLDVFVNNTAPRRPADLSVYQSVFNPETLQAFSLGYEQALSQYYWVKAIQYMAYCDDHSLPMNDLARMINTITSLDPKFLLAYQMGWNFIYLDDVRAEEDKLKDADAILKKGVFYNPEDYRIVQDYAFFLFYYKKDYLHSANLYDQAYRLKKPPFIVYSNLAGRLRANAGSPELAVTGLEVQLNSTTDETTRKYIELQINRSKAEIIARKLDEYIQKYKQERLVECPTDLNDLIIAGYIKFVPPDGLGGTFTLDAEKCRASSTTFGRLEVYYSK